MEGGRKKGWGLAGIVLLVVVVCAGLGWEYFGSGFHGISTIRRMDGMIFGRLPLPTEPSLLAGIDNAMAPAPEYELMTIKHIPPVPPASGMPHPYVGDCRNCHLLVGGPPAGSQFKTPVGAVMERLSRVRKLGPPILPTSQQPHPPAGRCIKCHDIVVKVPLEKNGMRWRL